MSDVGRGMLDFAAGFMPALHAATETVRAGGRLSGRRVGIALTLEPKTACLVEALASLGAEVSVLGNSYSTKSEVIAALRANRIAVFDASTDRAARDAFVDARPQLLADDGAEVVRYIHRERRDALEALVGVAEETTSGVRPLRTMAEQGVLEVACLAVNDARTKTEFDNVYGTGQSVVMAVLDATNVQLPGASVVVVGYGPVGRGIAATARALGGRVTVTEIDPVQALLAYHDGCAVEPLQQAVRHADLLITATGIAHSVTGADAELLRDGAIVAVGGMGQGEFDPALGGEVRLGDEVRAGVRAMHLSSGATAYLVADGHCANTTVGEGNPIEIMDLSLALQLRALDLLAAGDLEVGVHLLPRHIDDEVAASQLTAAGITLDVPNATQRQAARGW
jgi:adenosylhomocysteinase